MDGNNNAQGGSFMLPLLIPALIAGGASLVSSIIGGIAGNKASDTQAAAAQAGIDEEKARYEDMKKMLEPYTTAGASAVSAQGDLAGINGADAQKAAIAALSGGPEMEAMAQQGENAMLQNASATGGLRGGNLQGALAQFRPQLLSQLINQQYSRLGNLSQLGQASAAGVGAGSLQTGAGIAALLGQQGAAVAGGQLATGQGLAGIPAAVMAGMGMYSGLGGKF
jgi:hypothetical protein